ncbi:hypothetical protein AB0I61_32965 [Polymorphospora rubra]|uniref:hypothetical protein n=1 Tax=Polymorphospora rubra TaxID=338584 RepID=UPI0033E52892
MFSNRVEPVAVEVSTSVLPSAASWGSQSGVSSPDPLVEEFAPLPGFTIVCEGTSPLLMHNARLVDPLDTVVKQIKEVSGKTRKTDQDHAEMAHLEWLGGIYFDPQIGPFVPAPNLQKCLVEGARLSKDGKKIERGVLIETMAIPVRYDGPRQLEALYADKRFVHRAPVKVGMVRVMRTRPIFPRWSLQATGVYDDSVIDLANLRNAAQTAGSLIGIGDGRPTYGRFVCTVDAAE